MYGSSKDKPRVFSTYSKRKQFVRIVKDQWKDVNKKDSFDNVFDIPQPNTSTPLRQCTIPKPSPVLCTSSDPSPALKPVNLGLSGLFDDTPVERRKKPAKDITGLRRVLSISNNQNCSKSKSQLIPPSTSKDASLRNSSYTSRCTRSQTSNDSKNASQNVSKNVSTSNIWKNVSTNNTSQNISNMVDDSRNSSKTSQHASTISQNASKLSQNASKLSQNAAKLSQNTSKFSQNTSRQISSRRVTRSQSMLDSCSIHTSQMSTDESTSLSESDESTSLSESDESTSLSESDVSVDNPTDVSKSNVPTNVPINISSDTSTDESLLAKPSEDDKENMTSPPLENKEESLNDKLYSASALSPILDNSQSLFSTVADSYFGQPPAAGTLDDSYTGITQPPANCVDVSMASDKDDVSMASLNEDVSVMSIKDNVSVMSIVQDVSFQKENISPIEEEVSKPKDVSVVSIKEISVADIADDILVEEGGGDCNLISDNVISPVLLDNVPQVDVLSPLKADDPLNTSTARRSVLLDTSTPALVKLRDQCTVVTRIEQIFDNSRLGEFRKIGEGCFGEVYMDNNTVYKVVPVGGDVVINDSEQTSYYNALQEILVSKMLSDLSGDEVQMGQAFCQLKEVILTCGVYPDILLVLWDQYNERKGSDNERPDVFPADQRYVILLSKYSGVQLEDYCTDNKLTPHQAHSIVRQCCSSLAAAEKQYEFEHRDLHWGNVLIEPTSTELVDFTADGQEFILRSHGLLATIIDFTFSRLETEGCLNFVDLENEEWLFGGAEEVDIQFRVYRDMRRACRKNWAKFTPKTNVQWLAYLIDKMNIKIKSKKLKNLKDLIGNKKSAAAALPFIMRSL